MCLSWSRRMHCRINVASMPFSAAPFDVAPMLSQVAFRGLRMRGIDPVYLRQAAQRVAQMRKVEVAGTVVVRQVTDLVPVGSDLNGGKRRIRERVDVTAGQALRVRRPRPQNGTDQHGGTEPPKPRDPRCVPAHRRCVHFVLPA